MDWSTMLQAQIVVFGCGNILFGDDGLAPKAVNALAEEQKRKGILPHVAFIDAGTSIRPLLLDMILYLALAQKIILVDVVQESGRAAGTLQQHDIGERSMTVTKQPPLTEQSAFFANGFLHNAPTLDLLRQLQATATMDIVVLTVQAAHIPVLMDDRLSQQAQAALPELTQKIQQLCTLHTALECS